MFHLVFISFDTFKIRYSGHSSCLYRAFTAALPSATSALVPVDGFSFMSRYCIRPDPWFQCKLNIYLANDVKARVVRSVKPYLTLERKNKQGLTHMWGWICKHADICSFFASRGQCISSFVCRFLHNKSLLWKIGMNCQTIFFFFSHMPPMSL